MKTIKNKLRGAAIASVLLLSTSFIHAQQPPERSGRGPGFQREGWLNRIADLTDSQKEQIETYRAAHLEKMLTLRTNLDVLEAELKQLTIAKKPDDNKVNAKIDQIAAKKGEIMKERFKHKQDVRGLLTDEQRIAFDSCPEHRFHDNRHGHGNGMHEQVKGNYKCQAPCGRKG